jgi:hypothetical protein
MADSRIEEILKLLDPPSGTKLWYGGASVTGCLRGVSAGLARWKPAPRPHAIWELTLHLAYWKYAVRRHLEDLPEGSFPRSPSDWPALPEPADESAWKADRVLLRSEHQQLVAAIRAMDPTLLDEQVPGSRHHRYADLLFGTVGHDLYHVGQIQLLKRQWPD